MILAYLPLSLLIFLWSKSCNYQIQKVNLLQIHAMYRRMVEHFIYLTVTRSDITYSVHVPSRFMKWPQQPHLDAYTISKELQDMVFSRQAELICKHTVIQIGRLVQTHVVQSEGVSF